MIDSFIKLVKTGFFLVTGILLWGSVAGQEHSYVHYDVHDGLGGSTVYSMAQDKDGFIWFGTETGLTRFDGTHFKTFTTQDGLPDNEILKVVVDSKGRIWILPFKNTVAYYWKGVFHTKENDSVLRKIRSVTAVENVIEDGQGNIVLQEVKMLHIIDPQGGVRDLSVNKSPALGILGFGVNSQKRFRMTAVLTGGRYNDGMLGIFDLNEKDSFVLVRTTETSWWNTSLSNIIAPDLEITTTLHEIEIYDPLNKKMFSIPQPSGFLGVSRIDKNDVMINCHMNSYLLNLREQRITDSFMKGSNVSSILADNEGNIWFSTLGKGVYRLGDAGVVDYTFTLRNNAVGIFSIRRIDSTLWLGGEHFWLGAYDLRTGKLESGVIMNEGTQGRIMSVIGLGKGKYIVGSDLGVFDFYGFNRKLTRLTWPESIKTAVLTPDSTILVSSNVMVREYRLSPWTLIDSPWFQRSTCAYKTRQGAYYIGTLNGLYMHRIGQGVISLGDRYKELSSRTMAIQEAPDSTLWIATGGEGVVGFRKGRVTAHITTKNGLTSNICRSLFVEGGNIWVGTDKGLNKVVPAEGGGYHIVPYTMADGLRSDMINAIYVEGSDVYAGTLEGLTSFNDRKLSKKSICMLRVNGITVSDRQWPGDTSNFVLPHADNNIKFDFVGISYKSAGNIDYRYRLVGLDTSWKETRETFLSYPSLPSGNYVLELVAINKFGVRSNPVEIVFTVDKLLWERVWFRLVLVLSVAAIVVFAFNYRLRLIRRKEAEKTDTNKKMAELEQMALRSQMNPHFIFNCLNSIQQYVIYRDVLGANEFITKFSYLIRQTLDISARQSISLHEEINYIDTYMSLEKKRFDNKFIYEIVVAPEVDKSECHVPPMILQPYIENAVRHGIGLRHDNNGRLLVKMFYRSGSLVCVVEDNGVGRKIARLFKTVNSINYQSVGMSLVAKRIEMINKASKVPVEIYIEDIEDERGAALGTRINIVFPLEIALG